jgi:hypothetical protein
MAFHKELKTDEPAGSAHPSIAGGRDSDTSAELGVTLKEDVIDKFNPPVPVRPNDEANLFLLDLMKRPQLDHYEILDCTGKKEALTAQEFRGLVYSLYKNRKFDFNFCFDTTDPAVQARFLNDNASTIRALKKPPVNVHDWRAKDTDWKSVSGIFDDFLALTSREFIAKYRAEFGQKKWEHVEKLIFQTGYAKKGAKQKSPDKAEKKEDKASIDPVPILDEIRIAILEALEKDKASYLGRPGNQGADPDETEAHVKSTVKDFVTFMPPILSSEDSESTPEVTQVKLLYKGTLNNTMNAAKKYAFLFGRHGWALTHIQLNFKSEPILISDRELSRLKRSAEDQRSDSPTSRSNPSKSGSSDSEDPPSLGAESDTGSSSARSSSSPIDIPGSSPGHSPGSSPRKRRSSLPGDSSSVQKNSPPTNPEIVQITVPKCIEAGQQPESIVDLLCTFLGTDIASNEEKIGIAMKSCFSAKAEPLTTVSIINGFKKRIWDAATTLDILRIAILKCVEVDLEPEKSADLLFTFLEVAKVLASAEKMKLVAQATLQVHTKAPPGVITTASIVKALLQRTKTAPEEKEKKELRDASAPVAGSRSLASYESSSRYVPFGRGSSLASRAETVASRARETSSASSYSHTSLARGSDTARRGTGYRAEPSRTDTFTRRERDGLSDRDSLSPRSSSSFYSPPLPSSASSSSTRSKRASDRSSYPTRYADKKR